MYTARRYPFFITLNWSRRNMLIPLAWSALMTGLYVRFELTWMTIPWLPMSLIGVAVAFYLGFKNNASYDRTWEARKIWGAIVNASRSWAFSSRDFVNGLQVEGREVTDEELNAIRTQLVHRHVAWMDALRHQLRRLKSWEHQGSSYDAARQLVQVPEHAEDLREVLAPNLAPDELEHVLAQINPAAHLLAWQSRQLAELLKEGYIDAFHHVALQDLLVELMTQQGKAERIKNFPFPRQYATVNSYFAWILVALLPFGLFHEFSQLGPHAIWLAIPFTGLVSWVFLTTDQIGDWSENPFEGLHNDVPISSMSRGIERDIRQMVDEQELPPPREQHYSVSL